MPELKDDNGMPVWKPISQRPRHLEERTFLVCGNDDFALARIDRTQGATYLITHLPGMGKTISNTLLMFTHWCHVNEFQRATAKMLNPEYFGLPTE